MAERYEMPWRPTYEYHAAGVWLGAASIAAVLGLALTYPSDPFWAMAVGFTGMAAMRGIQGYRHHARKRRLAGKKLKFITLAELRQKMNLGKKHDKYSAVWLGDGFEWDQPHAQLVYEILKRDKSKILPSSEQMGAPWIHGVSMKEKPLLLPLDSTKGHTLICGTTGAGKTRLFDLLVTQAVFRGEGVIIIDPKGDKELRESARRACAAAGKAHRFYWFHPAFPSESAKLNPMANFNRLTEIASRVAAIMPGEGPSDPFRSYAQMAVNNVVQGLFLTGRRPSILAIRNYLENPIEELVIRSVDVWGQHKHADWSTIFRAAVSKTKPGNQIERAKALIEAYRREVKPTSPNQDLDGLISMFEHDRTHFSKMVASLLPLLSQLSSGPMGELLSPDMDENQGQEVVNTKMIVQTGGVLYVGLDALSDSMVGSAIGSLILADLTAVAGDRYNFEMDGTRHPVNLFIDEAAEVVNDPMIQLMNKGRGADFRVYLATQTYADFSARLGSVDKARQVLGNVNNTIAMRVNDNETQTYITDGLPTVNVQYVMRTQGSSIGTGGHSTMQFSGNAGERLMEEESELFKPPLLGQLPSLEFIAKVSGGRLWKGRIPILQG